MNYINITLLSLLAISTILYIIFYIKQINLLMILSSSFQLPLIVGTTITFLHQYFPDSLHVLIYYTVASFFAILAHIFIYLKGHKFTDIFSRVAQVLYCISFAFYGLLYSIIFSLHHIPVWTLFIAILFLIISVIPTLIIIKEKNWIFIITVIIQSVITTGLIYLTLLHLVFYPKLSTILQFVAAILLHGLSFLFVLNKKKLNIKHILILSHFIFIIIEILLSTSSILLFY